MPFNRIVELAEEIRATRDPYVKITLMDELRKLLDEQKDRPRSSDTKKPHPMAKSTTPRG